MEINKPVIDVTNDGNGSSVTLTIISDVGVTNKIIYKELNGNAWINGASRVGSGSLQQTGLIKNRTYTFVCYSEDADSNSEPSDPVDISVLEASLVISNTSAKVLKPKLMKRIAKRITAASKEFEITNGFIIKFNGYVDNTDPSLENFNPFTNEGNDTGSSLIAREVTFSAELDVVNPINLQNFVGGDIEIGDLLVTINSSEMMQKNITYENIKEALSVIVKMPNSVDQYGQTVTVVPGEYKIKALLPQMFQNFMNDLQIVLSGRKE